jgi:hypothetical protein
LLKNLGFENFEDLQRTLGSGFWENFQNQRTSSCCWVLKILKEPTGFMKELAV